jgi:hypothetical protein
MAWRDYLKVPAVQGSDLMQVEPFAMPEEERIQVVPWPM